MSYAYGTIKLAVEQMLRGAYGLRSLSLRYFIPDGADHDPEIGEADDRKSHLIPLVRGAARRVTAQRAGP